MVVTCQVVFEDKHRCSAVKTKSKKQYKTETITITKFGEGPHGEVNHTVGWLVGV